MKTGSARPNQQPYRNKNYSISNFGSTLADLKDLEMMQLQWILFNSPIPSAWGNSFSDNLTTITVNDCNLESSIPSNLGDISNLQHLDLQSNYLTGTIPQQLCNLRHLVYLDVSYNDLQSGAVPSCLNKSGLYLSTGDQEVGLNPNHGARSQRIITSTFFLSSFFGASASVLLLFLVNWALHPHSWHRIGFATGLEICTLWWRSAQKYVAQNNLVYQILDFCLGICSAKFWIFSWEFGQQNSGPFASSSKTRFKDFALSALQATMFLAILCNVACSY